MKIEEVLKPCPFCGRDANIASMDFDGVGVLRIDVDCSCGVSVSIRSDDRLSDWQGRRYQLGKDAIEKWNTRICVTGKDAYVPKSGKWEHIRTVKTNGCPEHWLRCSECKKYRVIKMGEAFPDWCENCGADMRRRERGNYQDIL